MIVSRIAGGVFLVMGIGYIVLAIHSVTTWNVVAGYAKAALFLYAAWCCLTDDDKSGMSHTEK